MAPPQRHGPVAPHGGAALNQHGGGRRGGALAAAASHWLPAGGSAPRDWRDGREAGSVSGAEGKAAGGERGRQRDRRPGGDAGPGGPPRGPPRYGGPMTGPWPSRPPPAPMNEEPLLEGDFGGPPGAGGGPRFHLCLTRTELQILGGPPGGGRGVLRLADVVGCHTLRAPSLPAAAFFAVYAYPPPLRGVPGGAPSPSPSSHFPADAAPHYEGNRATAERWARAIRCLVRGLPLPPQAEIPPEPRRRRLLLLLNPFGGRGQALSWCQTHVLPMITEADISFNLIQTERANHARELVTGISLDEWDGIVTVSGDGLLYEVVNGLMDRPDWAAALRMPLGILPCGSGNALAAAINSHAGLAPALGLSLLQNCAVLLCRGTPSPLDLVSVTTASGARVFSFLSVAWGLVADVDIESERLRRLGPARFALGTAAALLALHTYRGRLSYLPAVPRSATADAAGAAGAAASPLPRALSDLGLCAGDGQRPPVPPEGDGGDWGGRPWARRQPRAEGGRGRRRAGAGGTPPFWGTPRDVGTSGCRGAPQGTGTPRDVGTPPALGTPRATGPPRSTASPQGTGTPPARRPPQKTRPPPAPSSPPGGPVDDLLVPLGQPVPPSWVTLEGDFVLVLAIYQSHLGAELVAAPRARPDDGLIHLCYVRAGVSRGALLRALLAMTRGGRRGGGADAAAGPPLSRVPARAFRLEPLTPRGVLTVDGERVEYGPLQGQIHRGLARLLTPAAP
ncbi:LOW QUALITY PROTEIN: sphingosine kinase 2 [Harpia harpyja]|uniref:LOW QUALITY PROTEIN: sphingosine kinase 2 n=1 Tax=Harpia harpyja TaxID=202280 RepID=UPI0022B1F088|nr:LOW QUALITY PROTEIN: sphingosine kinase 2 [Harpia harpyja]